MIVPLLEITSGWTERLGPFTLRAGGNPVDLTGLTVTIILWRPDNISVTPGGTVTVDPDQVTNKGQVVYDPDEDDFTWTPGRAIKQDYSLHFKIVDGAGKVFTFPNGDPEIIRVVRQ